MREKNKNIEILDCTLRDGANVVGAGFPRELTAMILENLIDCGVTLIEFGHASGLGANENGGRSCPVSDEDYFAVAKPFFPRAELGMFSQPKFTRDADVERAAAVGMKFLRVGTNAGEVEKAEALVKKIRSCGMKARYSLMKAYTLPPEKLAEDAKWVESFGAGEITIMDSAGYMLPDDTYRYASALSEAVNVPIGFHGHNNLGLSVANAIAAVEGGATVVDAGLMGMARSVGNIPTELIISVMQCCDNMKEYDLLKLLTFIDTKLAPAMEEYGFHAPIPPLQLVLGYAGCHSHALPLFKEVAQQTGVDLFRLIIEASKRDRRAPSRELLEDVARELV